MNRRIIVFLMFATTIVIAGCDGTPRGADISTSPLPSSVKGYELYSWAEGDDWYFTLITGTNRTKTLAEVASQSRIIDDNGWVKITILGLQELEVILDRLPRSEQILLVDGARLDISQESSIITFPPEDMVEQVRQYSHQRGIKLMIIQ